MPNKRALYDWIIDAGLFAGFLVSFFLDITGVENHQILGLVIGGFLLIHLIRHWKWICSVTGRLSACLSGRTLLYWLLDAGLLAGFGFIIGSGLLMSTWLALPLGDYIGWSDAHEVVSILTLFFLVLKMFLHGRWILHTAAGWLRGTAPTPQPARKPAPANAVSRAQFLGLIGVIGAAATLAAAHAADDGAFFGTPTDVQSEEIPTATPATLAASAPTQAGTMPETSVSLPTPAPTAAPTEVPATVEPCTVLCDEHCAFPGRCRRYRDTNANGWCDNGECL